MATTPQVLALTLSAKTARPARHPNAETGPLRTAWRDRSLIGVLRLAETLGDLVHFEPRPPLAPKPASAEVRATLGLALERVLDAADHLVAPLNAIDGDPDLEPGGDEERSLASPLRRAKLLGRPEPLTISSRSSAELVTARPCKATDVRSGIRARRAL